MGKRWQILIAVIDAFFEIEDPKALGRSFRLAGLHVGMQGYGLAMCFVANYFGNLGQDWKTVVFQAMLTGSTGNVALHLRTPQVKAFMQAAQRKEKALRAELAQRLPQSEEIEEQEDVDA